MNGEVVPVSASLAVPSIPTSAPFPPSPPASAIHPAAASPNSQILTRIRCANNMSPKYTCLGVACATRAGLIVDVLGVVITEFNLRVISADYKEQGEQAIITFFLATSWGAKLEDSKQNLLERNLYDVVQQERAQPVPVETGANVGRSHTILDVCGRDRAGLLHDITRAMSFMGLQVDSAKIFSHKGRILDTFMVTENGHKLEDPKKLQRLKEVMWAAMKDSEAKINVSSSIKEALSKREESVEMERLGKRSTTYTAGEEREQYFMFPGQEDERVSVSYREDAEGSWVKIKCQDFLSLLYDITILLLDLGIQTHKAKAESNKGTFTIEMLLSDGYGGKLSDTMDWPRVRRLLTATVINPQPESDDYSIVEVFAPDRPNLLRDVTEALRKLGVQVVQARVSTYGNRVKDVFCITDALGKKILSEPAMAHIYSIVVAAMLS